MRKLVKIFITHPNPIGSTAYDFFILRGSSSDKFGYDHFVGNYWMSECEFAKRFLKTHQNYIYVGSADSYNHKIRIPLGFKKAEQ
jgi:hypothetical protein